MSEKYLYLWRTKSTQFVLFVKTKILERRAWLSETSPWTAVGDREKEEILNRIHNRKRLNQETGHYESVTSQNWSVSSGIFSLQERSPYLHKCVIWTSGLSTLSIINIQSQIKSTQTFNSDCCAGFHIPVLGFWWTFSLSQWLSPSGCRIVAH